MRDNKKRKSAIKLMHIVVECRATCNIGEAMFDAWSYAKEEECNVILHFNDYKISIENDGMF